MLLGYFVEQLQLGDVLLDTESALRLVSEQLVNPTPRDLYALCYRLRAAHRCPGSSLEPYLILLDPRRGETAFGGRGGRAVFFSASSRFAKEHRRGA